MFKLKINSIVNNWHKQIDIQGGCVIQREREKEDRLYYREDMKEGDNKGDKKKFKMDF